MYAPLSAAFEGATAEPPPHAEHIASATRAPAYFIKPVVFIRYSLLSKNDRRLFLDRDRAAREIEAARRVAKSFFIVLVPPTLRSMTTRHPTRRPIDESQQMS
jgi:hypothetical protein